MATGAILSGCSLEDHIADVSAKVQQDYAEVKTWDALPLRVISWQQALAMMKQSNAELLDADSAIRKAERDTISVYTDMIPGLSYYGYFTRSINTLSDSISAEDLSSRINMTFSIPTLTQVPYRVYAAQATAYAAIKAKEGKMRELESKLYKAVRMRELENRIKEHSAKAPEKRENSQAQLLAEDNTEYWKDIATLLGNYEARWQILPSSAPRMNLARYSKKLNTLDPLVVCNFAMELERARMAQYSVALRYLPTINTGLYSPSLFSSSGGTYQGTFLSGEETRINLSVSYNLDTKLHNWNQYEMNKDRYEATKRKVLVDMIDHKDKMQKLRKSIAEYNNWRQYMHKRMDFVRQTPINSSAAFLEKEKALHDMEAELLNQEKMAIETEAAIALEYGLPGN